jgi:hypothetical protein
MPWDMASRWTADRLVDEIHRLGARGLPLDRYFAELAERLRRAIDNDATCWHTLDPHTRLMTGDAPAELIDRGILTTETVAAAGQLLLASEYLVADVNSFAALAGRRIPVGTLDQATRGRPERSARYRACSHPWASRSSCGRRSPSADGHGARSTSLATSARARSASCESLPCPCSAAPPGSGDPAAPKPQSADPKNCTTPTGVRKITFSSTKYLSFRTSRG